MITKPWTPADVDVIVNSLDTLSEADADALIDTAILLLSRPVLLACPLCDAPAGRDLLTDEGWHRCS